MIGTGMTAAGMAIARQPARSTTDGRRVNMSINIRNDIRYIPLTQSTMLGRRETIMILAVEAAEDIVVGVVRVDAISAVAG